MDLKTLRTKRIGVLMGGTSAEREVSLKSGSAVLNALLSRNYDAVSVDPAGDLCEALRAEGIEAAFIALHGGHGENGAVQGLLEIMNIPYTGSGILASAMAMDKEASKKIFRHHGLPIAPFAVIRKQRGVLSSGPEELGVDFPMPWVVKPSTEGSSIGVSIVREKGALRRALKEAFSYGEKVIIEKFIEGREVQIGILNGRVLGGVEVRPSREFYNYEAKYTSGLTTYILPPRLGPRTYVRAGETALAAHGAIGCAGATRVDLIIDKRGRPYVLEVNTIPGMTETSLLPKIALSAGFDFPGLIEEILRGIEGEG